MAEGVGAEIQKIPEIVNIDNPLQASVESHKETTFLKIDRQKSIEYSQEIKDLEENKNRFEKLGFDVKNINFYVGNLAPNFGFASPFSEMIIFDKSLFQKDASMRDAVACHEIGHVVAGRRLCSKFFDSHPELREKRQALIDEWLALGKRPPPEMKSDFVEKLRRKYESELPQQEETDIDLDRGLAILEKFIKDVQRFRPLSVDPETFEAYKYYGLLEDSILFGRQNPFSSEKEYEDQAMVVMVQLGESLVKKIEKDEAEKYKIGDRHFIEEGACNYLAMKLLNISSEEIQRSFGKIDGLSVAQDFERKLEGKIEPLVAAMKKGEVLKLYKET